MWFSDDQKVIAASKSRSFMAPTSTTCHAPVIARVSLVDAETSQEAAGASSFTPTRLDCIILAEACLRRIKWWMTFADARIQQVVAAAAAAKMLFAWRPVTMRTVNHAHRHL